MINEKKVMELKNDGTNGKRRSGLEDQRPQVVKDTVTVTDPVMTEQSKWHEVVRY